ncbi:MAG: prolipoprotein diacylglyceryl transferase, partial [Proteobacteria bacterium]
MESIIKRFSGASAHMILHWNVDPILVHLGPLQVRYYGLFFVISFFIGIKFFRKAFGEFNLPQPWVDSLLTYMLIGTIGGARVGHCLFYDPEYYLKQPWKILFVWEGGLASHGAVVGIFTALYFYCRKYKLSWLWVMDRNAVPIACAGFLIRMGNLFNSEIIGK